MSAPDDVAADLAVAVLAAPGAAAAILAHRPGPTVSIDRVVREAGGVVSDLGRTPLRYNRPVPRFADGLIAAADPRLHQGPSRR